MDSLLNFLVRQKKLALGFSFSFIIIGLLTFQQIQRDQFPPVDFEVMSVTTAFPGASPEDVEKKVTNKIENELSNVNGIGKLTSTSREGLSSIIVSIDQDVNDVLTVKNDIRNAVNRVGDFPEEVSELPRVVDFNIMEIPVIDINIDGTVIEYQVARQITDDLEKALLMVDGVARVEKNGYLDSEIQVRVDPKRLDQYNISIDQIKSSIAARNARFTIGDNNRDDSTKNIVILSEYQNIEDLENTVIKKSFSGPEIKLKDIASVVIGTSEEKSITRVNGTKGFILSVLKQEQSDIIRTVERVKSKVLELQEYYPEDLNIFFTQDRSVAVENRLNIIKNNGYIGLVLVLIVLGIFLSIKTAFWVAISLPVALLGTIGLLGLSGETVNLISLSGIILVLGIVVDDSIIVAESIHHYKSKPGDMYANVVKGFKRVILPVATTIITTILVMSSMFLMTGTMGKFIYVLPVVVIFALLLSFLEITFALPAHLANNKQDKQKTWFIPIENWFERIINRLLVFRYWVVTLFLIVFGFSLWFGITQMPLNLFPSRGADTIFVNVETPNGSSASSTEQVVMSVEKIILEKVGGDLDSLTSKIGSYFSNVANLTIVLTPTSERELDAEDIADSLELAAGDIAGAEKINFSVLRPGPPSGEDIEINLVGDNDFQRLRAADRLEEILSNTKGVKNIIRDDELGKDRIEVVLDFAKMSELGVTYSQVYRDLRTVYSGSYVTNFNIGGKETDVRMYLGGGNFTERYLESATVSNNQGRLINLTQFASVRSISGEPDYNHYDGERTVKLSASVDDEITTPKKALEITLNKLQIEKNFPQIRFVSAGGAQETLESLESFQKAFIFSIFGVFFLIALLFNSYSQPLLVLASVPFAFIGVIWSFYFHGEPLSFFALMGSLALIGVIVNDSLVMVSHLNYIKQKYSDIESPYKWIARGARGRLRAVVLTSLTTLCGVLPLAYGIGGVDLFLQPMVLALGYGLLFGTIMTLILLPCMYSMNYDFIHWLARLKEKRQSKSKHA